MARTWLAIKVELLGGRGEACWPYPGRIFAVGPAHTFHDLAEAINTAFARWDRAHLSEFTLADGTMITDPALDDDPVDGPADCPLDIATAKVAKTLELGEQFQFIFDLGDNWVHQCTVERSTIDPVAELGIRPAVPLAYWGWGDIPDQYGRSWENDDGENRTPPRPAEHHPMLTNQWPTKEATAPLDMAEVRGAAYRRDPEGFAAAITGRHIDDALQQIGSGAPLLLEHPSEDSQALYAAVLQQLTLRGYPGDRELAEDLSARLHDEPLSGRAVAVDLEMFVDLWEGDPTQFSGGYLDLDTGAVFPGDVADPLTMGDDNTVDVEADPDRYLWFDHDSGRDGWQDMASFANRQPDSTLRARLEQSIRGRGAFRAFRDIVYDTGLGEQWNTFSLDRQLGRAREFLATEGIRAV